MTKKIAIYGGSFNPPGSHHREIAARLGKEFDEVIVVPCGPRPDKPLTNDVNPVFRAAMVDMTFRCVPHVRVDLFDLEARVFMRTHELDRKFSCEGEVWHVVGTDLIKDGARRGSFIQREWSRGQELWEKAKFAVITRPGYDLDEADLPPNHQVIEVHSEGSSSSVRQNVFLHRPIGGLVLPSVARYIRSHNLYRGVRPPRVTELSLEEVRLKVICDKLNPEAVQLSKSFPDKDADDPSLIVVIGGDGTMLRAIREHWRLRIPFYGINAGHIGFLLNEPGPANFLNRRLILQQLPLLRVETADSEGRLTHSLAFNDTWVERDTGQSAWIQVMVDGQERLAKLVGDGVLVATAAGSGSYARAMGATPVPFDTPTITLVGSNVLKPAFWKPVVLPLDAEVEFNNLDPGKRPWRAYIDGVLQDGVVTMRIRASKTAAVELAFDPGLHPAEKLAQIQFPPPEV